MSSQNVQASKYLNWDKSLPRTEGRAHAKKRDGSLPRTEGRVHAKKRDGSLPGTEGSDHAR